jgi:DNA-binding XRE family transcriptional regulator
VTDHVVRDAKPCHEGVGSQRVGDAKDSGLVHAAQDAKSFGNAQANILRLREVSSAGMVPAMSGAPKPFADIADRIRWHRTLMGLSQQAYADKLGFKRSAFSLWEAGSHRLSLDGALALRAKYGLSLDFMYAGIDDALPMTLRNAWRDRP